MDRADLPELRDKLKVALRNNNVDLDFAQVNFIDSTCGRLLMDAISKPGPDGRRVKVRFSPQVTRTLEFLNLAGSRARTTFAHNPAS